MKERYMSEKNEWEVIDAMPPNARQSASGFMKGVLGPQWRWKAAGAAIAASLVLLLLAAITSAIVVVMAAGAILSIGIGKLRQWLRRDRRELSPWSK
jgi:hypothetical protein